MCQFQVSHAETMSINPLAGVSTVGASQEPCASTVVSIYLQ